VENNILELKKVCKHYPKFDLKDVSFSIPYGSIMGFIGRNGAGKTTTLKGLMKMIHFNSGEVFVFGKNMEEQEKEIKQNIGFTLSELTYYPNKKIKTIVDVTSRFYPNFSYEKFNKCCELFNLDINKKLEELSSGMKVKYSLAVALSSGAKLLILDEPTSGLDPISRDEILDIFKDIVKDKSRAILFSTHITSDLDKCASDITYIHKGEIIFSGSKDELLNKYILINGKSSELEQIKDFVVSYKDKDGVFEALIESYNKDKIKGFKNKVPDLEEIMIFIERKDSFNEEFVL